MSSFLSASCRFALSLGLLASLAQPTAAGAEGPPGPPSAAVTEANKLIASGHAEEAITLLEAWCKDHPDDHLGAQTLLSAKVALKEQQIRSLLAEQAVTRGMVEGDIDYENAKARADKAVQNRLAWPEYYLAQKQYGDAAALCNAILHDYPNNEAVLCLKYRILELLVARERDDLLHEQSFGHGEGINETIRESIFPADPPKIPRTEWIFDEDIQAAERAKVLEKLNQKVAALIYDGTNGTQSAQVRELLTSLFALTGINYVLLDDALGNERLTIHLIDVSVGDALAVIAKMVKVRFNYSGNTVYVTSADSEVMETRIIHLRSGLTDVDTELEMAQLTGAVGPNNGGPGQPGPNGQAPNGVPNQPNQNNPGQGNRAGQNGRQGQNGQQPKKETSDLEKFLDKVPDIIVDWPDAAKLYLDRKSNTLYVRSTPSTINELERLINSLDYNNVQVVIEARFIEVTESAEKELGVDWQGGGTRGPLSIGGPGLVGPGGAPNPSAPGATINGTSASIAGAVPPTNGLFATALFNRGAAIAASITALEQKGQADTLSDPKILSLNNSVGVIQVSQNVNYIANYTAETTSQTTTVNTGIAIPNSTESLVPNIAQTQTGITLRIKPSVARNSDVITLSIQPMVQELIKLDTFPFQYATGNGTLPAIEQAPEIATRSLVATLHVQNGQTVALGGLTRESDQSMTAGVPFFSRIPLLGQLFRHDSRQTDRRNLVILVTASIVDPSGSKLSDEVQRLQDSAKVLLPASSVASQVEANPNGQVPTQVPAKPER